MHNPGSQVGNTQHILVCLRGQAQHEVELYSAISPGKGRAAGGQQLLLGNIFIDDIPQTLGTRLRSKCQTGLAALGQPLHEAH